MTAVLRRAVAAEAASVEAGAYDAAVAALYAAGTRDASWEAALDAVLATVGFEAATFHVHDRGAVTFDPAQPVVQRGPLHCLDLAGKEPWQGEVRPWHWRGTGTAHVLSGSVGRGRPFLGSLTLYRRREAGAPTTAEQARFRALFAHLERALLVEYRLHEGERASLGGRLAGGGMAGGGMAGGRGAGAAGGDGPNGVVLLDRAGLVLHANAAAVRLASAGLRLVPRLGAAHAAVDAALGRAVAAALAGKGGLTVRVPRPDGGRDHVVLMGPVPANGGAGGLFGRRTAAAYAIVVDVDARVPACADLLRATFGLSAAETRLLAALADGRTVAEVSGATGLSPATLRTQLAALFRKTGTGRQAELVQLAQAVARAAPAPP